MLRCDNGLCISKSEHCNGKRDCCMDFGDCDWSDEAYCLVMGRKSHIKMG